jgi:hypothetical protein
VSNENPSSQFVSSLQALKRAISTWAKDRRNGLDVDIKWITVELDVWDK